jgi:hypothetical protein
VVYTVVGTVVVITISLLEVVAGVGVGVVTAGVVEVDGVGVDTTGVEDDGVGVETELVVAGVVTGAVVVLPGAGEVEVVCWHPCLQEVMVEVVMYVVVRVLEP